MHRSCYVYFELMLCVCVRAYARECVSILCMSVCVQVCAYFMCVSMCVCLCLFMCLCVCMCVTLTHACMHLHAHMHTPMCTCLVSVCQLLLSAVAKHLNFDKLSLLGKGVQRILNCH